MWSDYDIDFFQSLGQPSRTTNFAVAVFDIEDIRTESDFEQFVPGGHLPLRTPVLAVITGGHLKDQMEGEAVLSMTMDDLAEAVGS
jgi:hypothetical protein